MGERVGWTDAEDAVIKAGKAANKSYEEIATDLPGRTKAAVSLRAYALGLSKPRAKKEGEAAAPAAESPAKPKRVKKEAAAPTPAAEAPAKPKRTPKAKPAEQPAAAAAPAAVKPKRTPKPAAAPMATNGHHAPSSGAQVLQLGSFRVELPAGAAMSIVPGGVAYDLGNGQQLKVAAAS